MARTVSYSLRVYLGFGKPMSLKNPEKLAVAESSGRGCIAHLPRRTVNQAMSRVGLHQTRLLVAAGPEQHHLCRFHRATSYDHVDRTLFASILSRRRAGLYGI